MQIINKYLLQRHLQWFTQPESSSSLLLILILINLTITVKQNTQRKGESYFAVLTRFATSFFSILVLPRCQHLDAGTLLREYQREIASLYTAAEQNAFPPQKQGCRINIGQIWHLPPRERSDLTICPKCNASRRSSSPAGWTLKWHSQSKRHRYHCLCGQYPNCMFTIVVSTRALYWSKSLNAISHLISLANITSEMPCPPPPSSAQLTVIPPSQPKTKSPRENLLLSLNPCGISQ